MLNQVVLVGRLVKDVSVKEIDGGKSVSNIVVAVPRSFKNKEGEYETDFIECTLWENLAKNTMEYCHKGDILGIKGRLQSRVIEEGDKKKTIIELIAEKVTFLNSKNRE